MLLRCVLPSPTGPLYLVASEETLCSLSWSPPLRWLHLREGENALIRKAQKELEAYFKGTLETLTPFNFTHGTPFQKKVWSYLRHIPYGETLTYQELAQACCGSSKYTRAVSAQMGRNPLPLFYPCHRVIALSGGGGFGGGMSVKNSLLSMETKHHEAL